ncbi:hypothetical protein M422DRAFT_41186 [Sphaerobolus stellatus SS14]|nr:hypothetical protein M422DRAFT_41186 [Sphaerobolus stellatus SS14]
MPLYYRYHRDTSEERYFIHGYLEDRDPKHYCCDLGHPRDYNVLKSIIKCVDSRSQFIICADPFLLPHILGEAQCLQELALQLTKLADEPKPNIILDKLPLLLAGQRRIPSLVLVGGVRTIRELMDKLGSLPIFRSVEKLAVTKTGYYCNEPLQIKEDVLLETVKAMKDEAGGFQMHLKGFSAVPLLTDGLKRLGVNLQETDVRKTYGYGLDWGNATCNCPCFHCLEHAPHKRTYCYIKY